MGPKEKQRIIDAWIAKHGGLTIDLKTRDIIFHDGGCFWIKNKKVKYRKIVGYKDLEDGCKEVLFSKKKTEPGIESKAYLWFEELDEHINYLNSLKRMLNKIGCKTNY